MRKTLELIALVLTIVASLVAIIVFLSGRNSLPALISSSTPTTVSSSVPISTTTITTANEVQPDYLHVLFSDKYPESGLATILVFTLVILSFVVMIPGKIGLFGANPGCADLPLILVGWFGIPMALPFIIGSLAYTLLEMSIRVPIYLILCTYLIDFTICLSIAYIFKRWLYSRYLGRKS